jgi:hypothetical protein
MHETVHSFWGSVQYIKYCSVFRYVNCMFESVLRIRINLGRIKNFALLYSRVGAGSGSG